MELGIESEKDSGLGNLIRACYRSRSFFFFLSFFPLVALLLSLFFSMALFLHLAHLVCVCLIRALLMRLYYSPGPANLLHCR